MSHVEKSLIIFHQTTEKKKSNSWRIKTWKTFISVNFSWYYSAIGCVISMNRARIEHLIARDCQLGQSYAHEKEKKVNKVVIDFEPKTVDIYFNFVTNVSFHSSLLKRYFDGSLILLIRFDILCTYGVLNAVHLPLQSFVIFVWMKSNSSNANVRHVIIECDGNEVLFR